MSDEPRFTVTREAIEEHVNPRVERLWNTLEAQAPPLLHALTTLMRDAYIAGVRDGFQQGLQVEDPGSGVVLPDGETT